MKQEEQLLGLELHGFGGKTKFNASIFNKDTIAKIRLVIQKYYSPIKKINEQRSSYGLKHDIEKYLDAYITNGELIYAMDLEGYKVKNTDNKNACFNISEKGVKALKEFNQQPK